MKRATIRLRYGWPGFQYFSLRSRRMDCPLSHWPNLNGPVPIGLLAVGLFRMSVPANTDLQTIGRSRDDIAFMMYGAGFARFITTVYASGVSIEVSSASSTGAVGWYFFS